MTVERLDGIALSGGSAFGLAACHGAMRWCEERGRGLATPVGLVPIVVGFAVFDRVLVAVGRRPNAAIPGLDKTQVKVDQRGFIKVDGQLRTDEPSIFAGRDLQGATGRLLPAAPAERIAAIVYCADTGNEEQLGHPGRVLENVKMLVEAAQRSHKPPTTCSFAKTV